YLNLLPNPRAAFLPLLTLVLWLRVPRDRKVGFLLLSALFYSSVLIYALAIFPTPRMFLPAYAALALAFAAISVRRWDAVAMTAAATYVIASLLLLLVQPRPARWQAIAEQWVSEHPGQVETTQQDYYTFSPALQSLPSRGRPYLLQLQERPCNGNVVK